MLLPLAYLRWHLMCNQAQLAARLVAAGGRFWLHPGSSGMVVARDGLVVQIGERQTRQVEFFLDVRASSTAQSVSTERLARGAIRVLLSEASAAIDHQFLTFAP